jgi:hypothetical protein
MHICKYVCKYVCVHVCVCSTHVSTYICTHEYICMHMYLFMHAFMYLCVRIYMNVLMLIYIYRPLHACVCVYVCMYIGSVCVYVVIAYFVIELITPETSTDINSSACFPGNFSTTVTNVRQFYSCQMWDYVRPSAIQFSTPLPWNELHRCHKQWTILQITSSGGHVSEVVRVRSDVKMLDRTLLSATRRPNPVRETISIGPRVDKKNCN